MAGKRLIAQDAGAVWRVTINDLIGIFRQALIDLIPTFERARIQWRGDQTYDDFERVAEALYNSIIRDSVGSARDFQTAFPIARYGFRESKKHSRILVNDPSLRLSLRQLVSVANPFDTIESVRIESTGEELEETNDLPFEGARFIYEARYPEAPPRIVDEVDVET